MSNAIVNQLKSLKLHGMAQTFPDLMALAQHSELGLEQLMNHLLMAETNERAVRSMRYQLTSAKFPNHRDLAGFEFEHSAVDKALVLRFAWRSVHRLCKQCGVCGRSWHRQDSFGNGIRG